MLSRYLPRLLASLFLLATVRAQDLSRVPPAEQLEAARQVKIYRESTDQAARETAFDALLKMNYTVMQAMVPVVERDWQLAVTNYRLAFERQAAEVARKRSVDPAFVKDVATQRGLLAKLRNAKGGPSKEDLHTEGEPALAKLRELFKITVTDLTTAVPALATAREQARALTRIRAKLKKKILLHDDREYSEADLDHDEATAISKAFHNNQAYQKVLDANAEMIAKKLVPPEEGEGVRDLNEMRLLLGLAPVLIDPKLHEAARGHSKDMATLHFFSHESPVAGKKTPWDRAKLAGTTASAENIYAGSESPQSANVGWFASPGHHVNMFGNHRRVGMGRYEGTWTQMFGQ
jgi:uncharacterized protein YkwD